MGFGGYVVLILLALLIGSVLRCYGNWDEGISKEQKYSEYYGISVDDVEFLKSLLGKNVTREELEYIINKRFGDGHSVEYSCAYTADNWYDYFNVMLNGKRLTIGYKYSPYTDKVHIYKVE